MAETIAAPYEIGSEFHWEPLPQGEYLSWPDRHVWFQTGRSALAAIWDRIPKNSGSVLWVPDYFCGEVVDFWEAGGIPVRIYCDNPLRLSPVWESLTPSPGDAVLAVNYFGNRAGEQWHNWRAAQTCIVLVEDHTHDPFSSWSCRSRADYAFASIRKIFPVPDGALVWSPVGHGLLAEPGKEELSGTSLKFAAMFSKAEFLKGGISVPKEIFREMQVKGEAYLGAGRSCALSPWSRALLRNGYPVQWRMRRRDNANLLLSLVQESNLMPLIVGSPGTDCPFNAVFLFSSREMREKCRIRLIANNIYPAVHWNTNGRFSSESEDIAQRILTIPVDQRYTEWDMRYIASHLLV